MKQWHEHVAHGLALVYFVSPGCAQNCTWPSTNPTSTPCSFTTPALSSIHNFTTLNRLYKKACNSSAGFKFISNKVLADLRAFVEMFRDVFFICFGKNVEVGLCRKSPPQARFDATTFRCKGGKRHSETCSNIAGSVAVPLQLRMVPNTYKNVHISIPLSYRELSSHTPKGTEP